MIWRKGQIYIGKKCLQKNFLRDSQYVIDLVCYRFLLTISLVYDSKMLISLYIYIFGSREIPPPPVSSSEVLYRATSKPNQYTLLLQKGENNETWGKYNKGLSSQMFSIWSLVSPKISRQVQIMRLFYYMVPFVFYEIKKQKLTKSLKIPQVPNI